MVNRELFVNDPCTTELLNNGVVDLATLQPQTIKWELKTFVWQGEYINGFSRIVNSFLTNISRPEQQAVWISGFFGSGKSHLAKMLKYLWEDSSLGDSLTARGVSSLPDEIQETLRELSTIGIRYGGLRSVGGKLSAGASDSMPTNILRLVYTSLGLPERIAAARFILWLKEQDKLERIESHLAKSGSTLEKELVNMYVSPKLAKALLAVDPSFATNEASAKELLRSEFKEQSQVDTAEMIKLLRQALETSKGMPCTLIVIDEVQQYIGENARRSYQVQEVVEALSHQLDSKVLVVATGQSALTDVPALQRLQARFMIPIHLSDRDVENVTREVVLRKKPQHEKKLAEVITKCQGEISRQLSGTRIETRTEDNDIYLQDYPILPVRRRFWEHVLRAVDTGGTTAQLRTQLRIVHDANRSVAEGPIGTIVPSDFIYDELSTSLLQTGKLSREIFERIDKLKDDPRDGLFKYRLCALVYLIGQLPREASVDIGVRATADTLADLMLDNLVKGSSELREKIPFALKQLVDDGILMHVEDTYQIKTRAGVDWDHDFQKNYQTILQDLSRIDLERSELLRQRCGDQLKAVNMVQGRTKTPRKVEVHYTAEQPSTSGQSIPIWVRDGWGENLESVMADVRKIGDGSPMIFVYIPSSRADELKKNVATWKAAQQTINSRGNPTLPEGIEARKSIETRRISAENQLEGIMEELLRNSRVFLAGGSEHTGMLLPERVKDAAEAALSRMYPQFDVADDPRWEQVFERARAGAASPLESIGFNRSAEDNDVCKIVLRYLNVARKGTDIHKQFAAAPYGWPKDTIDGALLSLMAASQVKASQNGSVIERDRLQRSNIGITEFRSELIVISAQQRLAIRQLFTNLGVQYQPNQELASAQLAIDKMLELASRAGGDAPLPERPGTAYLDEIYRMSGNELLMALHDSKARIEQDFMEWSKQVELVSKRTPPWEMLQKFMSHAAGLPVLEGVREQVQTIVAERMLLSAADYVPTLNSQLLDALRSALIAEQSSYRTLYDTHLNRIKQSEIGKKLPDEQLASLLAQHGVLETPAINVGSDKELLSSLDQRPLSAWKMLCDALPQKFERVLTDAVKLLEPQAVRVTLPSRTLRTPEEVNAWIEDVRAMLAEQLKNGPIII